MIVHDSAQNRQRLSNTVGIILLIISNSEYSTRNTSLSRRMSHFWTQFQMLTGLFTYAYA